MVVTKENAVEVLKKLAEPFKADEIEWRIGQAHLKNNKVNSATCFAYLTRVAVQQRLDDIVGPESWKCEYKEWQPDKRQGKEGLPAQLCGISIRIDAEWITKWDGAQNTDTEGTKGGISDSFKRAANCWGIGRYLYLLEQGWAEVFESKVPGSSYGQHKVKDARGQDTGERVIFYWKPPQLPASALPKGDGGKPRVREPENNESSNGAAQQPLADVQKEFIDEVGAKIVAAKEKGESREFWEDMWRAAKKDTRYNPATKELILRDIAEAGQESKRTAA